MDAWNLVERKPAIHVLPSIWVFKIDYFPDLLPKKFKAYFCVWWDQQIHWVDYFETWTPVVHCTTIRTVIIMAAKEKLILAQCDITIAFVHVNMPESKYIYVHQSRSFNRGSQSVLCLNWSSYGMRQSPRYFFKYPTKRLKRQGLKPSDLDPCLFISDKLVVLIYVDGVVVYIQRWHWWLDKETSRGQNPSLSGKYNRRVLWNQGWERQQQHCFVSSRFSWVSCWSLGIVWQIFYSSVNTCWVLCIA